MSRGVQRALPAVVVAALIALAGCSHYLSGEREAWRHDAEVTCLGSGSVKEGPARVQISAISGPGICGIDFPLRVSALGVSGPLSYDDESLRPPGAIPQGALPPRWPGAQPNVPPQISARSPPPYGAAPAEANPNRRNTRPAVAIPGRRPPRKRAGRCRSTHPAYPVPEPDSEEFEPAPPRAYDGAVGARANVPPAALPPSKWCCGKLSSAQVYPAPAPELPAPQRACASSAIRKRAPRPIRHRPADHFRRSS